MTAPIIVCVFAAISLGVAAWKLPRLRSALLGGAAAAAGMAGLLIALAGAKGDLGRAKRNAEAKRQIKAAVKDHKKALIAEQKRIGEVQDKIDAITEEPEPDATLDLEGLADRFNSR